MSQEKTVDVKKGEARDDRLQYIRKTQQEVGVSVKLEQLPLCHPCYQLKQVCLQTV